MESIGDRIGSEENPGKTDKNECHHPMCQPIDAMISTMPDAETFLHAEQPAVKGSPAKERPVGSVPEPADYERHHKVYVLSDTADPVATKRDVEVVFEPRGKGDVPAVPELTNGTGEIRLAKVLHESESQYTGSADGDERVAREVAVYLERKE